MITGLTNYLAQVHKTDNIVALTNKHFALEKAALQSSGFGLAVCL